MTEQIALALGWMYVAEDDEWHTNHGTWFPACELQAHLDSPAGRESVRDRVRELAGKVPVAYYYEPDDELKHTVCVESCELDFNPWLTESEAWTEALLWLADQAEKGGQR